MVGGVEMRILMMTSFACLLMILIGLASRLHHFLRFWSQKTIRHIQGAEQTTKNDVSHLGTTDMPQNEKISLQRTRFTGAQTRFCR